MQKIKIIVILVIIVLVSMIGTVAFAYYNLSLEVDKLKEEINVQEDISKTIFFAKLFIDKVLLNNETVSFEDRLRLENAVRDLSDMKILNQWQKFVDSDSDDVAQKEAGGLFNMLLDKIY